MVPRATVLHVDDDPDLLELSAFSFDQAASDELEMVTASDAVAGLDTLESQSVDCLVSDSLRLPDDTPFIVAARQREPSIPIVFYTAKGWDTVALDALEARVSEYIRKGDEGDIAAVIERVRELAKQNQTPTIDEEMLFDGRPCDAVEEAVDTFPAESVNDAWTVIGVHDWEVDDELATTIAQVMEAYTGIDALEAEPLFSSLDMDALDSLLEPRASETPRYDIQVRFPYEEWELSVSSDGFISVRPLPETDAE
ncbi:response regulator with chey-like receiver, aaa-type ATPase, and DNA-binding domains [Halogeometricum borinquense DSM 11551]|uniref:response regulator with CheY-like receiver, AAA-type ATPase, and DNA-binding domains n=1 Tax=Halogeometricum borinquense (strain ATCC 700274 / DSM 11551 / JCM 10706 / KCTC 4070 / PR3) TaxID=469382 RepID=E4NNG5_HALBP|nr:HalOD1 output domain-containing protein [Halogeometricum borinquense]ADQ66319.1 response regulator with CheY-like receiver, AAA-type ATPase, and DNA-binding domains [Halogeometricum borinquense DSM 11551]ELY27691.1 response regulator with chey-like receiver, aaa-type ATPase, and DNA-binding domains [Halogeometricum borinquense DSM 11551]